MGRLKQLISSSLESLSASFGSAAGALLVADDRISGASGQLAGAITHTHSIGADKLGRIPNATWRGRVRGRDVSAAQIKQGSGQEYRVLMSLGGCPKHDDVKGRARTGRVSPTASEPAASVAALETSGRMGLSPDGDVAAGLPAVGTGSYPFFILCRSLRLNRFGRMRTRKLLFFRWVFITRKTQNSKYLRCQAEA